jgi:hypothetical protein
MRMPSSSRLAAARVAGPWAVPSRLAATVRTAGPSALSSRVGAATGIVGPVAFTGAWLVASLRQTGHSAVAVQLSGLAALDARDPGIMIAGFVALGACSVAFGGSLHGHSADRVAPPALAGPGSESAPAGRGSAADALSRAGQTPALPGPGSGLASSSGPAR